MFENDKITYNESPFKSIILDIKSILPRKGYKTIQKGLKYGEEIKELKENFKNSLINLKNVLIEKFFKNNRIKKADRDYYEYEENKFYGLKDVRNLFDQNDDDDEICEEIEYLFNEKGLEYEEFIKLMPVKVKKEYVSVIYQVIEQEAVVNYDVNYYKVNYEYEKIKKVAYIKSRSCLIDCEYIICEIIEDQKVEYCEMTEDQNVEYYGIMEDQKVEDINMLKLSVIEADVIRRLNLTEDELRVIALLRIMKIFQKAA